MLASVNSTYTDPMTAVFSSTIAGKACAGPAARERVHRSLVGPARDPLHAAGRVARVLAHSIVGSFAYGVVAVKLFFVHDSDHPRWRLPLVGGTLFAVLVTLWATSALWYFTDVRFGF